MGPHEWRQFLRSHIVTNAQFVEQRLEFVFSTSLNRPNRADFGAPDAMQNPLFNTTLINGLIAYDPAQNGLGVRINFRGRDLVYNPSQEILVDLRQEGASYIRSKKWLCDTNGYAVRVWNLAPVQGQLIASVNGQAPGSAQFHERSPANDRWVLSVSSLNGGNRTLLDQFDVTIVQDGVFNVIIIGAPGGGALTDVPAPLLNDLETAFGESNRFLGLTITRGTNGQVITNATELVPRQQILSAPFAFTARNAAVATIAVRVVGGAITTSNLQTAVVTTDKVQDGSITLAKLMPRPTGTNVPVGGIAISGSSGNYSTTAEGVDVTNLSVTLVTGGRPVFITLISDGTANAGYVGASRNAVVTSATSALMRNAVVVARHDLNLDVGAGPTEIRVPPSSISHVDLPPAGTNTYKLQVISSSTVAYARYVTIVAYEF